MIPNMPSVGIRFDVAKINNSSYGIACWKIFWQAVEPAELPGAMLYEGDTAGTLNDAENVFCIAIQCFDSAIIEQIKLALIESEAFRTVCARPRFVEADQCTAEPLAQADQLDFAGNLSGEASNAAYALKSVRGPR